MLILAKALDAAVLATAHFRCFAKSNNSLILNSATLAFPELKDILASQIYLTASSSGENQSICLRRGSRQR